MNENPNPVERVIGLDAHPDSFTAALIRGPTPAAAIVEKVFNQVPLARLPSWAQKHTTERDLVVLEASGNSFQIVRRLAAIGRRALVLESCQMGKLKEAHANNDKISAVRIGKAYLAGTAKTVWVPDAQTQERRDWFHAHRKAIKRTTQMRNRVQSYLSDNGRAPEEGTRLAQDVTVAAQIRQSREWSPRQWQVIEGLLLELRHAEEQRQHWRRLIAQEVLADPQLLSIVRLCGVREMVAFALGAFIGDIRRFAHPANSSSTWGSTRPLMTVARVSGAAGSVATGARTCGVCSSRGRRRSCAVPKPPGPMGQEVAGPQGANQPGRGRHGPQAHRRGLVFDDGSLDAPGRSRPRLRLKVGKILSQVGAVGLQRLGKTRKAFRQEIFDSLTSRIYVLNPNKKFVTVR